MMGVKAQFCMMYGLTREIRAQDSKNLDRDIKVYEAQARSKMCRMPHIEASPCIFTHVPIVLSFFPGRTDPFALLYAYFIKTLINSAPYVIPYY